MGRKYINNRGSVKIVFWGTPIYAAENLNSLVNAGYDVIAVITQPDRKRGRGNKFSPSQVKQVAIKLNLPVYTTESISKDKNTKNKLLELNPDMFIVVAFGQILPVEILKIPKFGCWNSHASLLPAWRGAAPIQWSILNDDTKTGVCIMAMEKGLDTGPIINTETTEINDTDNLELLTNRLSKISAKLLIKSIEDIKKTKGLNETNRLSKLNAIDQISIDVKPTYARQIKKEDFIINWNERPRLILKKILGLYPNAYTTYNGKRIKLTSAILIEEKEKFLCQNNFNQNINIEPGKVIMIRKKLGLLISLKEGIILITSGQLEGKKMTDGYTLSIQSNLKVNSFLGI